MQIDQIYKSVVQMEMSDKQEREFFTATECHICKKIFNPLKLHKKVRDHCHLTGEYRGAAHSYCNLTYKDSRTIPVLFHNLSGYDAHFIIKDLQMVLRDRYLHYQ